MRKFTSLLLDLFFPPRCAICGEVTFISHALCENCREVLQHRLEDKQLCPLCSKDKPSCICHQTGGKLKCVSVFEYDEQTFALLKSLKNKSDSPAAAELAAMMAKRLLSLGYKNGNFDYITAVAPSKIRMDTFGFNHAEHLARELSKILSVPYIEPPIVSCDSKTPQHSLTRAERYKNAESIYHPKPNAKINGNVLLVDDIITTGATLMRCQDILYMKGAKSVLCLTAATTQLKE